MHLPGTVYKSSNKFSAPMALVALVMVLALSIGLGYLYGLISFINPLIYINFIVLIGAVVGVGFIGMSAKAVAKSRNAWIDRLFLLTAAYVAWHVSWTYFYADKKHIDFFTALTRIPDVLHYAIQYSSKHSMSVGRLGSGGVEMPAAVMLICYVIEFGAFFVPLFMSSRLHSSQYYCEHCNRSNTLSVYYDKKPLDFTKETAAAKRGDLSFIRQLNLVDSYSKIQPKPDVKNGARILQIHISNCLQCKNNPIADLYTHTLRLDDKGKEELKDEEVLVEGVYFDPKTLVAVADGVMK